MKIRPFLLSLFLLFNFIPELNADEVLSTSKENQLKDDEASIFPYSVLEEQEEFEKDAVLKELLIKQILINRFFENLKKSQLMGPFFKKIEAYIKYQKSQMQKKLYSEALFDEEDLKANPELEQLLVRNMIISHVFDKLKLNLGD